MPRLTLELIQRSPQDLNPAKDRQLTMRGHKIEAIENLGATQDFFSCIDLTDNSIMKLASIPTLPRLRTLMLANNQIKRIDPEVVSSLTHLESLVLTKNKLEMLCDLNPLGNLKALKRLCLLGNTVATLPEYRFYVIYTCRNTCLRVLDFRRILDSERKLAEAKFSGAEGEKLLLQVAPKRVSAEEATKEKVNALDKVAVERIKQAIMRADTMEEVSRLEKALKIGHYTAESLEELLKPSTAMEVDAEGDKPIDKPEKIEAKSDAEKSEKKIDTEKREVVDEKKDDKEIEKVDTDKSEMDIDDEKEVGDDKQEKAKSDKEKSDKEDDKSDKSNKEDVETSDSDKASDKDGDKEMSDK